MKKNIYFSIFFALFLAGCSTPKGGTENLEQLQHLNATTSKPTFANMNMSALREQVLQETAMSTGAQSGLAMRAKQINALLEKQDKELNQSFNFNLILLPHNVLPPVLVEGRSALNLDDPNTIRLADRTYRITKQARFVTAPPTWRDYLWMSYSEPGAPAKSLLPKTKPEQRMWKKFVTQGWEEGVRQADAIFGEEVARLKEDYKGMVLYKNLLHQGMVSAPFVARTELGVTGDKSNLRINDQVLRIAALPEMQSDAKAWKPATH